MLEGRTSQLRRLDDRLAAARRGESFALLVHGQPGIGKSALLDEAVARADAFQVLRTTGLQAEADIPFAALRTLVEPLLELRERLPPGQAKALGTALALEPPTPQDRFAVAVSLLALLGEAAMNGPLLAVVDDVQWLDPASRDTLLFVARRLGPGGIGLLLAARDEDGSTAAAPGLERLAVGPLDPGAAHALLSRNDLHLAPAVAREVAELADGNPLALLELPATLTPRQRTGEAVLGDLPRPGPRLEHAFAQRFAGSTMPVRRTLATAAAMESGTLGWLLDALGAQGIDADALDAAERERALVVRDGQVSFRHPLLRAAAYHAARDGERGDAHRALAASAPDPRRRAWHLAAAAGDDADEEVAAALEEAARHARAVGGHAEAASAFVRASQLSTDARHRGRRELAAAEDLAVDGDLDRALMLLQDAAANAGEEDQPAVTRLRGNLAMRRGDPEGAYRVLSDEGDRRLRAGDHALAATLYLEAAVAPMFTGDVDEEERIVTKARAAAALAGGALEVLAELLAAEVLIVRGHDAEGTAALERIEPRLGEVDLLSAGEIVGMAAQAAMWAGSSALAERIVVSMLAAYEDAGAAGRVPYPLSVRAQLAFRRGQLSAAQHDAAEAVRLARDTGQTTILAFTLAVLARVEAWMGRLELAREMVAEALAICEQDQSTGIALHAHVALVDIELLARRPEEAIAPARRTIRLERGGGLSQLGAAMWAGGLLEALAETGRLDEASSELALLEQRAREGGSAYGTAVILRGHVLLAPAEEIDARAAAALAAHEVLRFPLERARTELAVGERLRRLGRRAEARPHLIAAAAAFDRLGAVLAAARARSGVDGGAPRGTAPAVLTAEEHRIGQLVALGRTNREIAGELYVSEKTVERRLSALYRRLGIASRIDLVRIMSER